MAKRKYASERPNYGGAAERRLPRDEGRYTERSNGGPMYIGKAMMPNNPGASLISEDWSQPALLKRGVHEINIDSPVRHKTSGRLGDLYAQVDKTSREDQAIFDKLTDPTNW